MHLVSYDTAPGATHFPVELRVSSTNFSDEAHIYRRVEVEEMPVSSMWWGGYDFVATKPSQRSLIDVWVS